MKTHTQQKTKLNIETIATEEKFSYQKRSEYRPRKWRGNTLVPVIIALSISAIATVAFLNQGATLNADNKIVMAQNEVASALSEWIVAREAAGGADKATVPGNPSTNVYTNSPTFHKASGTINEISGVLNEIEKDTRYFVYPTDNISTCKSLKSRFSDGMAGYGKGGCVNQATAPTAEGVNLLITLD